MVATDRAIVREHPSISSRLLYAMLLDLQTFRINSYYYVSKIIYLSIGLYLNSK